LHKFVVAGGFVPPASRYCDFLQRDWRVLVASKVKKRKSLAKIFLLIAAKDGVCGRLQSLTCELLTLMAMLLAKGDLATLVISTQLTG